jgi:hypothetical protein
MTGCANQVIFGCPKHDMPRRDGRGQLEGFG